MEYVNKFYYSITNKPMHVSKVETLDKKLLARPATGAKNQTEINLKNCIPSHCAVCVVWIIS